MKSLFLYWVVICSVAGLIGCSTIKQGAKEAVNGFLGVSTKVLEDKRKDALKQTFNLEFDACYKKVKDVLANFGAYTYAEDLHKGLIAVYISAEETTPVGLFLTRIDNEKTQVEVSSPSAYGKELIAKKVFLGLEGRPDKRDTDSP